MRNVARRRAALHEGGLQPGLEGGDGARMLAESCVEMREREFLRSSRSEPRRSHHRPSAVRMAPVLEESLPDAVGRGIAQSAIEIAEGLQLVAAGHGLFEKGPQASAVRNRRRILFATQMLKVRPQPLARLRLLQKTRRARTLADVDASSS